MRKSLTILILVGICLIISFISTVYAEEKYFSDNSIGYRYGTMFKEPGVANGADIIKNIVNFSHFNTDKLGSNFLSIDALFSHANDPANNSEKGAREIYAIYRRDWSLSKITGKDLSVKGIIRDVALHMGGDINTKNVTFTPFKRLVVIGPQIQFAIPNGFFNLAFDYSQEWNHNGIVDKNVSFDPAFEIEASWGIPFKIYKTSWKFTGFFNYIAPKGLDGFGAKTKAEILTRPQILLDVGQLLKMKNSVEVGFGYEYWLNKFGNNHKNVAGSLAKTPMLIVKVHF